MKNPLDILHKKVLELVRQNVSANDELLFVLVGTDNQSLIALQDRILIVKIGLLAGTAFGGRATTFYYRDITSIEINTGWISGVLEILTPSYAGGVQKDFWNRGRDRDPFKASNCIPFPKNGLKIWQPYIDLIRKKISESRISPTNSTSSTSTDIASQLEKLSNLKSSGALTADEYQKAKNKLLNDI